VPLMVILSGETERHSLRSRRARRATTTSGVKVAQHPQGLTLTLARGEGAGWAQGGVVGAYGIVFL
jgi:hypothetical protein